MNIGFFGDSYVDVFAYDPLAQQRSWSYKLLEDFSLPIITTGNSGTSQFHAITEWLKFVDSGKKIDVAIWTFTWDNRLYSQYQINQIMFSAAAEQRQEYVKQIYKDNNINPNDPDLVNNLISAHDYYLRYIYNESYNQFIHSLMVKWVLDLPNQYPDIKFIFIPNTELSNKISKQYFRTGILLDFAFEILSNLETGSPGPMPINCTRVGHLNSKNITIFKDLIKEIIENYSNYQNSIFKVDYNKFDIRQ